MASRRIAILGGGPAGSSCALYLLRLGVAPGDITIFDKAIFPRPKLCGGALTHRGTEALHDLVGQLPQGATAVGLEFRSQLGSYRVREPGPQWLYDRAYLDEQLLRAAQGHGVTVREGVVVTGLEPGVDEWRVRTKAGVESFDWVVGADGASGISRRAADLPGGWLGRLVEAVYEPVSTDLDPEVLHFDFDPICDGIPGYAWLFRYPKPGATGLWKLGVMDGRGVVPGEALRQWTTDLAERHGFRPVDEKIPGWPERYYCPRSQAHRAGLILVGEAWGIDPLLGEGIAPSFAMAEYGAARLKEALDHGEKVIPDYESAFRWSTEGVNLRLHGKLARLLYGDRPFHWLRVLFENEGMHRIAGSGQQAYGRLARKLPSLCWAYGSHALRRGLPSSAPIARDRTIPPQ